MRKARLGKPHSTKTKQTMSQAKLGRPKASWREWTRNEDALLGEMPDEVVALRTERTVT
jgi:hypothetical protein